MKRLSPPPHFKLITLLLLAVLVTPAQAQEYMHRGYDCRSYPGAGFNINWPEAGYDYACRQIYVFYAQQGSWCARDWYRSCMHAGWNNRDLFANSDSEFVIDPTLPEGNGAGQLRNTSNQVSSQNGWVVGYTARDKGKVAPQNLYISSGSIIVYPYVCRGYLKTSPNDPGQRIQSNDEMAKMYFPNPTLQEIQRYVGTGACQSCPAEGNMNGDGCS